MSELWQKPLIGSSDREGLISAGTDGTFRTMTYRNETFGRQVLQRVSLQKRLEVGVKIAVIF
jgi:hypothetical protein